MLSSQTRFMGSNCWTNQECSIILSNLHGPLVERSSKTLRFLDRANQNREHLMFLPILLQNTPYLCWGNLKSLFSTGQSHDDSRLWGTLLFSSISPCATQSPLTNITANCILVVVVDWCQHVNVVFCVNFSGVADQRAPKVVFIVSTVNLVSQQKERFQLYIDQPYRVSDISGATANEIPLQYLLENDDVVVMTAQILVNALNDKEHMVALSDISLLILDECHHTQKEHPYNKIMEKYLALKLQPGTQHKLPQVRELQCSVTVRSLQRASLVL